MSLYYIWSRVVAVAQVRLFKHIGRKVLTTPETPTPQAEKLIRAMQIELGNYHAVMFEWQWAFAPAVSYEYKEVRT